MRETPGRESRLRRAAREPLAHFLALGAAIYVLYALAGAGTGPPPADRITVTAGEIGWLSSSWEARWQRPPTPEELDGLVREYVRETVLYREALAMGLDRDDTIIRRRLAQKLEFLAQDLVATVPPTEEELLAYFAEHAERYEAPALTTFTQVFVDPDKRGERTRADAETIASELRALGPPGKNTDAFGDLFMLQAYYPERPELEIAKLFGAEFAKTVARLEPGRWHGPVLSGYGVHVVYVDQRRDPLPAEFAEVRERVHQDWADARREKFNEEFYANLLGRYEVVVEGGSTDDYAALEESAR